MERKATVSKKEIVQTEGNRTIRRTVDFYNLDVIIAVGYGVNSKKATLFRLWATETPKGVYHQGLCSQR
ncbi:MAG: RhuM family protein [Clostridiales bacterium]